MKKNNNLHEMKIKGSSTTLSNYSKAIQSLLKDLKIRLGDFITIKHDGISLSGNLLPQSEIGNKAIIVIKQKNGYNVGIKLKKNSVLEKTGDSIPLESYPKGSVKVKASLPKVSLLATGGTIASRLDYLTGGVVMASSPEEIMAHLPELSGEVQFQTIKQLFQMASEDIGYLQWQILAQEVAKELKSGSQGVVIMHGTDMLGYSAAALSFMLENLNAPVIFTAGQRSSDRGSFDGALNLLSATRFAALSDFSQVMVCMHETSDDLNCLLLPGTNVRKLHTSRRDAFKSINSLPIARISHSGKITEISSNISRRQNLKPDVQIFTKTNYEPNIALIKIFPGINPELLDWYIDKDIKGVIIEGTGLGHIPTFPPKEEKRSWLPAIERAIESDVIVGMTSQCIYGRTHQFVYRALRTISQKGVLYLGDMISETALVKLGWSLGQVQNITEVKKLMLTNLRGELSSKSYFTER